MGNTNVGDLPIMKVCCKTCPFKLDENGKMQDEDIAKNVIKRTLFQAQQICHSTEGENREPRNRCRGAFDYTDKIYRGVFGFGFEDWKNRQK